MTRMPTARIARLQATVFSAAVLGGLWLWIPAAEGWREGTLIGAGLGLATSWASYEWKRATLKGKGSAFLAGMVGGFALNLVFLAGGTILAWSTGWLGNHQGFAIAFLGVVLLLGGVFTWALHHEEIGSRR